MVREISPLHKKVGGLMPDKEKYYRDFDPYVLTIDELMDNLNAEEDEKPYIENVILLQAQAYVNNFINITDDILTDDEKIIKKRLVLAVATDWYYNRAGEGNLNKKSYTGINTMFESIRDIGMGISDKK